VHDGRTIVYRASTRDCRPCPAKPKCTPNMTFRKIPRDMHEDARDTTRALISTPEFAKSRNERKKVEMRFAHLKTHHGFERMRLRGLSGARDEIPPRRHRAELEDTRQLYLAAIAEHPSCMRRLSVSGVQPRTVGRRV
jgi:Transposase DDE domain